MKPLGARSAPSVAASGMSLSAEQREELLRIADGSGGGSGGRPRSASAFAATGAEPQASGVEVREDIRCTACAHAASFDD